MKTINRLSIGFIFVMLCSITNAQNEKALVRQGNNDFKKGDFSEAEIKYRKSLDKEYSPKAQFNLGDALYEQKNYEAAAENFSELTKRNVTKDIEADAYYNLGNTLMAQEKYTEAFESYKNALKSNPHDEDARYNLEYARWKMIQQQQQDQDQQNQNQQQDYHFHNQKLKNYQKV